MGAGHAHALYFHGHSLMHRLPPQCKVAATVAFVLAVVSGPREALWLFGVFALMLGGLSRIGEIPAGFVLRRMGLETPFLLFALFLPLVGQGPRVEVLGMSLSVEGLWGAWNILAKATLGFGATILLAATTPVPDLLRGLERLRIPKAVVAVAGFMVRYLEVVVDEMRRMTIARQSRGYQPSWIGQARPVAASVGALFIRTYERGERVYLSMLSRGYSGQMPELGEQPPTSRDWLIALSLPGVAWALTIAAWVTRS